MAHLRNSWVPSETECESRSRPGHVKPRAPKACSHKMEPPCYREQAPLTRIVSSRQETRTFARFCRTGASRACCFRGSANKNAARRQRPPGGMPGDRTSVVEGKSVSVRVDVGGRRILKKK